MSFAGGRSEPGERSERDKRRVDEDDDLEELPPLDGDGDEPAASPEDEEESFTEDAKDGADPLDDSTGEADPVEELPVEEGSWLADAEPAGEAGDIDTSDLFGAGSEATESVLGDNDTPGMEGEDFGLNEDNSAFNLDGGEEGPLGKDEELSEADLPELDADEEGDLEDAVPAEEAFVQEVEDDAPFPWVASPWTRVGSAPDVGSAVAVVCDARAVFALVSAEPDEDVALVRVDLEGGVSRLPAQGLATMRSARIHLVDGELWVEGENDSFRSRDRGVTFEREGLPTPSPEDALPQFALFGDARVTAAVRAPDGLLAAIASRLLGRGWLVWHADGAEPRVVAEVASAEEARKTCDEPDVFSLAWDETRGVVWAAGRFGLFAFQINVGKFADLAHWPRA